MPSPYPGYLSEIRMMAHNRAPNGWVVCDGSVLQITENQGLYQLLGTTFGGDGQTTFALPDLRGRVPVCAGESNSFGTQGGEAEHQLTAAEVPGEHRHLALGSDENATLVSPLGNALAQASNLYASPDSFGVVTTTMATAAVLTAGGEPHENRQPYLAISFFICTVGDPPPSQEGDA
jgi:microcystin-dependent protein